MGHRPSGSVALRLVRSVESPSRVWLTLPVLLVALAWAPALGERAYGQQSVLAIEPGHGDYQILAISGDAQPGASGALLAGLTAPAINDAGQAVIQARLVDGVGGVESHNDLALWFVDGATRDLLAWKGNGGLPGGASVASFAAASIANDGDVAFKANLDGGQQGFWRAIRDGGIETIAVSGVVGVPGPQLKNAEFQSFGFQLMHSSSDYVAYNGRLRNNVGGVFSDNSRGVWRDNDATAELVIRQSFSEAPGLPSSKFLNPSAEGVNASGQLAVIGALVTDFGGVTANDNVGIWRVGGAPGSDVMVARRGLGAAAGTDNALFLNLSDLRINAAGAISYVGELEQTGGVTATNNRGLWLFEGSENRLVARTGVGAVPQLAGAEFETLDVPLLNDAGHLLFAGGLKGGVGGVTAGTAKGIWIADGAGPGAMVARSGVGGVPGVPTAKFAEFGNLAFNADGVVALAATMEVGPGGVAAGNEQGLWLMDATGDGRLIARTGDLVEGRTVAALEFLGGSGGGDGRQRALNDFGQFAYKAIFDNGDEAALLYTPALNWRAAGDGAWEDSLNWTLGITPGSIHEATISSNSPITVAGPSGNATVRRLHLGGGSGETTLEIPESGMLAVSEGLYLAANGRLAGKGTLAGEVINVGGATSPGTSIGVLAINGDYRQEESGRLAIEIGGADNSSPVHPQFDQLLVFGHADLGGALEVSLVNGFVPSIGDQFPILQATGGLTSFDLLNLPPLPSDRAWLATTTVDSLALAVVAAAPASPADFNGDGHVDAADLDAWKQGYGSASGGDADQNGVVDGNDFLVWQREFRGGSAPSQTGVPEPTGASLAIAMLGAALSAARRRSNVAVQRLS